MGSGPRPLKSLLHTVDAELGSIVRHAAHLRRVREAVLTALPAQAGDHVHVASVDPGRLLLHVDSAGWAGNRRCAAPRKLPLSEMATNWRNWRRLIDIMKLLSLNRYYILDEYTADSYYFKT